MCADTEVFVDLEICQDTQGKSTGPVQWLSLQLPWLKGSDGCRPMQGSDGCRVQMVTGFRWLQGSD